VDNRVYVIGHDNTLMRQLTQMGVHMFGAIESIKSARIKPAISFDSSLAPFILKHRIPVSLKCANITLRASEQTWKGGAACSTSSLLARRPRPRLELGHMFYHVPMDTLSVKQGDSPGDRRCG
jgi:hypothetical protein